MGKKSRLQVVALDTRTVIDDFYKLFAALFDINLDIGCSRVKAVFYKFFDCGIRSVNYFPRRYSIID